MYLHLSVRGLYQKTQWGCGPRGLVSHRCQQLGRLGFRCRYQEVYLMESTVYSPLYFPQMCFHSAQPERRTERRQHHWCCLHQNEGCIVSRSIYEDCIGRVVCVHAYWEHMLRTAYGWTWGHVAHLSSIGLPDASTSSAVVALLLIQPCSESA